MGRVALGHAEHAQVGHNDRIHPDAVQKFQKLRNGLHLPVAGHGVAGDVDIHAVAVAQGHRLLQLLAVKVSSKGPHTKLPARQIDGIGPVGYGHPQPLHIPRRGQKLDLLSLHRLSFYSKQGDEARPPVSPYFKLFLKFTKLS